MFENLFDDIKEIDDLERALHCIFEGKSWEHIAKALYQILDNIDTASDICKENLQAFQNMVMKLQAKKNMYLYSPDGYSIELVEAIAAALSQEELAKKVGTVAGKQLIPSSYSGEESQRKFWLLTNGKLVPVKHTHRRTAFEASGGGTHEFDSTAFDDLFDQGAIAGYVTDSGEMGLRTGQRGTERVSLKKLTSKQRATIQGLYIEYKIGMVFGDFKDSHFYENPKSTKELNYLLDYGTLDESKINETIADRVWDFLREHPDSTYNEILDGIDATGEDAGKFEGVIDDMLNKSIYVKDGKYCIVESIEVDPERLEEWIVEVIQEVKDAIDTGELKRDKFEILAYLKTNYKANNPEKAYEEMEQAVYDWYLTNMRESLSENLCAFAKRELDIAGLFDRDSDYNGMLGKAVMELMQTFAEQGHSGASAALTVDIFDKLASWKPLTELTDNPDEWQKVSDWYGGPEKDLVGMEYQSKRSPSCFSSDGGKTYYDVDENPDRKEKIMHKSKHFEKEE